MRCPKCGYTSFDYNEVCPRCRKSVVTIRDILGLPKSAPQQTTFLEAALSRMTQDEPEPAASETEIIHDLNDLQAHESSTDEESDGHEIAMPLGELEEVHLVETEPAAGPGSESKEIEFDFDMDKPVVPVAVPASVETSGHALGELENVQSVKAEPAVSPISESTGIEFDFDMDKPAVPVEVPAPVETSGHEIAMSLGELEDVQALKAEPAMSPEPESTEIEFDFDMDKPAASLETQAVAVEPILAQPVSSPGEEGLELVLEDQIIEPIPQVLPKSQAEVENLTIEDIQLDLEPDDSKEKEEEIALVIPSSSTDELTLEFADSEPLAPDVSEMDFKEDAIPEPTLTGEDTLQIIPQPGNIPREVPGTPTNNLEADLDADLAVLELGMDLEQVEPLAAVTPDILFRPGGLDPQATVIITPEKTKEPEDHGIDAGDLNIDNLELDEPDSASTLKSEDFDLDLGDLDINVHVSHKTEITESHDLDLELDFKDLDLDSGPGAPAGSKASKRS
ncbi:MAG: hypothetical protein HQK55_10535 [Deltaproteobacteria bacterium]|nr:hypothetical protein [Deltaproteobacteria bacterium]